MKQIIILLLVIILGFVIYDFYKDYTRFNGPDSTYKSQKNIDPNYHDKTIVLEYQNAVADLDNYTKMQWSVNDIDLLAPEINDAETKMALKEYAQKKGLVKQYESILVNSAVLKSKGLDNEAIKAQENGEPSRSNKIVSQMFNSLPGGYIPIGSKGAAVYELQKLLVNAGNNIPLDGIYSVITMQAVKKFEANNNLFADGVTDPLTLYKLLELNK